MRASLMMAVVFLAGCAAPAPVPPAASVQAQADRITLPETATRPGTDVHIIAPTRDCRQEAIALLDQTLASGRMSVGQSVNYVETKLADCR
jgi:hypothetical protein